MSTDPEPENPKWVVFSPEEFEERCEASMEMPENWLEKNFEAIPEFLSEMDDGLIDDSELEVLYFLVSRIVAACLPKGLKPPSLTADELWKESGDLLAEIESWNKNGLPLSEIPDEIRTHSVQPAAIDFSLSMLVEFGDNQDSTVRPDSIIPIVGQIEAVLRQLKAHLA
jgi:hypothetical protein